MEATTQGPRYYGHYEGVVIDNKDPLKLNRVKVRAREVMGDKGTAWARVIAPFAGASRGFSAIPEVNDGVAVVFEAGDANRPLVVGGLWFAPDRKTQIPQAAYEKESGDPVRGQDEATAALGGTIQEPADGRAPQYPSNKVIVSKHHTVELDDTDGKERLSITHRKAKVYFDIYADGTVVFGTPGKRYVVVGKDDAEHVKGKKDVVVDGNFSLMAKDLKIQGEKRTTLLESEKMTANQVTFEVAEEMSIEAAIATIKAALVTIGPGAGAPVITQKTFPFCYVTGLPILGEPTVVAG